MLKRLRSALLTLLYGPPCPRHPGHRTGEKATGNFPDDDTVCSECWREEQGDK